MRNTGWWEWVVGGKIKRRLVRFVQGVVVVGCGWYWGWLWLWLVLGCRAGGDRLAVLLMASHLLLLRNRHNSESWGKCRKKTQQVRQNNNFEVYKLWVKFLKCGQGKNHLQVIVAQQVIYCYWIYLYRVHTRSVLKYFSLPDPYPTRG